MDLRADSLVRPIGFVVCKVPSVDDDRSLSNSRFKLLSKRGDLRGVGWLVLAILSIGWLVLAKSMVHIASVFFSFSVGLLMCQALDSRLQVVWGRSFNSYVQLAKLCY